MDLTKFKKAELLAAGQRVGLAVLHKDTKKTLVEKFEAFIAEAGEDAAKLVEASLDIDDDAATLAEESVVVVDADDTEEEKAAEAAEDDDAADDDADDDAEYRGPPIDVKAKLIDPVIDWWEQGYARALAFTDRIGATTLDYNDELRENLSGTISLNFIELGLELVFFFVNFVALKPVKYNGLFDVFRPYTDLFDHCSLLLPDLTSLVSYKISSVFVNWLFYAVALPLVVSYYVNFTRRVIAADEDTGLVLRIYKYDPFIFALTKVLIYYFVSANVGTLTTLSSVAGVARAIKTHFLIQLGFFKDFTNELGTFPLVLGVANVAIGLYSQFEEY